MNDRRRELDRHYLQEGSPGYQRIRQQIDEGFAAMGDRVDAALQRIDGRLNRMERDIAQGELDRRSAGSEIAALKIDLGEVRDAMRMAEGKRVESAARGAASGAAQGAASVPAVQWWKTWTAKAVAVAIGFVAIVTFFEAVPKFARGVEGFWAYIAQRQPEAAAPKKDQVDGE